MLNLTFGQTIGSYDSVSAAQLPSTQKGLGVITICLKVGACPNELYLDLVIGYNNCPKLINTKLIYRLSATQPLQAQADSITREISSLMPDVAISWTSTLTAAQFTLTGYVTGSVPISGSVYGNSVSTINFTYANPVALNTQQLVPGTPYLLNVGTYPTPTPATNILGINQVSSGVVAGGLACAAGAPPLPTTSCPDVLKTFPSFVGVVGASKGSCGTNCQEIITRGTVKIKLGEIANPTGYVANNWALPFLSIDIGTRQFVITYIPVGVAIGIMARPGLINIGVIRTLEVTPFTATIIL